MLVKSLSFIREFNIVYFNILLIKSLKDKYEQNNNLKHLSAIPAGTEE